MLSHKNIYRLILDALGKEELSRSEVLNRAIELAKPKNKLDSGELRGRIGSVLNEMVECGVVSDAGGIYSLTSTRPVALRIESCEKEMLSLLRERPMSKPELRAALVLHFGTDKTTTTRDDNILFSLIGQVTKRLMRFGVIELVKGEYRVAPEKAANIDDISDFLTLKNDFITRLHSKGGEFFEHFIIVLLSKYLAKSGKVIDEAYVMGGAEDRGIDGIIKTTDTLGFRETLMIQAKNRLEVTSETAVRGFYGAVCAAQGSRGIFATTSDFHPAATEFLSGIDNCVGVNADKIFAMACECLYGVKRKGGKYMLDTKIL